MSETERCEVSDLPKYSCSHCVKSPELADRPSRVKPKLGEITVAQFNGVCGVCGDDILPGDNIGPDMSTSSKKWIHYGCGS